MWLSGPHDTKNRSRKSRRSFSRLLFRTIWRPLLRVSHTSPRRKLNDATSFAISKKNDRGMRACDLVAFSWGDSRRAQCSADERDEQMGFSHARSISGDGSRSSLSFAYAQPVMALSRDRKIDLPGRYEADRAILVKSIASLGRLTADNQGQHDLIKNISVSIQEQITLLDQAMNEAQTAAQNGRSQNMTTIFPTDVKLPALLDKFESTEHELLKERTSAVEKNARWSLLFIISTGILSVTSLLLSAYHVQREILERARIESGLLRARELMGTQLDQQKTELEHAVEDL